MTTPIGSASTGVLETSRFTRHRVAWTLAGLGSLVLPVLWPVGVYILWKVYANRPASPIAVATVPPQITGGGWRYPAGATTVPTETRRADDGTWTSPGYRSAGTRARWAQLFFGLVGLGGLMQVAFLSQGMNLVKAALAGEMVSDATWASYLKNSTDADNFYGAAATGLAITFIAWLSRTVDNVPPLGGGTPHDSPRWAIGWWFVPIAFLWKPYTVVRDAWQRLATANRAAATMVVGIWWLGFVGATALGRYANAAFPSADVDDLEALFAIGMVAGVLAMVSATCGFLVVREIQARSDVRAGSLGPATTTGASTFGSPDSRALGSPHVAPPPGTAFCPACGTQRSAAGRFCASCGADLGALTVPS